MRISDWSSDVCSSDLPPGSTRNSPDAVNMLAVPGSEIMLPEVLKAQGYHTIQLGKWHLGAAPGSRPEEQGFDETLGFMAGASMYLPENDKDTVNSKQPWEDRKSVV